MSIKRFDVYCLGPYECCEKYVDECDDGEYMLYEDHAATQERVEKLEACVHALRAIVESADKNQAAVNTALLTDARKAVEELL